LQCKRDYLGEWTPSTESAHALDALAIIGVTPTVRLHARPHLFAVLPDATMRPLNI